MKIERKALEYLLEHALKNAVCKTVDDYLELQSLDFLETIHSFVPFDVPKPKPEDYDPSSGNTAFKLALRYGISKEEALDKAVKTRQFMERECSRVARLVSSGEGGTIDIKKDSGSVFSKILEELGLEKDSLGKIRDYMHSGDFPIHTGIYEKEINALCDAIDEYLAV